MHDFIVSILFHSSEAKWFRASQSAIKMHELIFMKQIPFSPIALSSTPAPGTDTYSYCSEQLKD